MNSTEEYMKWVDGLPANLQKVVTDNWDYTGRATDTFSQYNVIIQLLNISNTLEEFSEMYKVVIVGSFTSDSELDVDEKIRMYWGIYMNGLKRAVDDILYKKIVQ